MRTVKILIYEPSEIIIAGIKSILKQILGKNIEIFELVDYNNIIPMIFKYQPDIVLLDMSLVKTGLTFLIIMLASPKNFSKP